MASPSAIAPALHPRPDNAALGITMIVAAVFTMSVQDAVVKLVSAELPLWQIFAVRSLIAIPALVFIVFLRRDRASIVPNALGWAFLRSFCLVFMYVAFYAALPVLSLSVVAAAYYTGPLFIAVMSAFFIGDRIGWLRGLAIVTGFSGVLVILRPGSDAFSPLMLIPILSAIFYASAAVITRGKSVAESPLALSVTLNFAFIAIALIATSGLALWNPAPEVSDAYPFLLGGWVPLGGREWAIVGFLALANVVIHLALARAYQSASPAIIATFDYSYLIFAVIWGVLLFADWPDAATLFGMVMIAGAGLVVALGGRSGKQPA